MFRNIPPPPPKKSPQMFEPNVTMITTTADDATMNVISWIHDFPHPPLAGPRNFRNEALPHIALIFCILRA